MLEFPILAGSPSLQAKCRNESCGQPPCPALRPVQPSRPRAGSGKLVPGLCSITANVDICLCQTSQKSFPVISRKCSDLPNARAKGAGHSDASLPLVTFSEPRCCNLIRMCLSSSWDCSAQASHLTGSPLIERFLYLLQMS